MKVSKVSERKKRYTLRIMKEHKLVGKIDLEKLVHFRKMYFTQKELAKKFGVSQVAICKALKVAKEKGIYDGKIFGKEVDTDEKLSGMEIKSRRSKETEFGRTSKYRCLRCHRFLIPLENVTFEGKREPAQQLIDAGFSHICPKCYIVYGKYEEQEKEIERKER